MTRIYSGIAVLTIAFAACTNPTPPADQQDPASTDSTAVNTADQEVKAEPLPSFPEAEVLRFDDPGKAGTPWLGTVNVVTFFTDGQNKEENKRFTDAGFSMHFLGAQKCAYYVLPQDSVGYYVEKGRQIGFESYGFLCESLSKPDLRIAVNNQIEVRFKDMSNLAPLSAKYGLKEVASFGSKGAVFRFYPNDLSSLVRTVYELRREKGVESVHFDFQGCEEVSSDV